MMVPRFSAVFLLSLLLAGPAMAAGDKPGSTPDKQYQGTPEDQTACDGDAKRFCKTDLSDSFLVLACLQDHREKLHKACRKVLENNGQ
jgi:hypothetical protein